MTDIRRYFQPNHICFLTHVTYNRAPILVDNTDLLRDAMNRFISGGIIAWAILPDHFHILLNPGEQDVSSLMVKTKLSFSMAYRKRIGVRKGRIWQYRFWDHLVRNENDMQACFDYIHSNPVKHGLSKSPFEWEYSSARDYLSSGHYDEDWMICDKDDLNLDFGE